MSAKRILTAALRPFAAMSRACDPARRVWAHASLAARIAEPLPSSVVVLGAPEVHGTGRISFGRNLYLYRDIYLETREEARIVIGDGVVISRGAHLVAFSGIAIGEGSMIGEYASIRDADHVFGDGTAIRHSGHRGSAIVLGRNTWVGRGVTILAGVTVGDNAVIGANAVVTRDVPKGALVGGVPARPLVKGLS